MADQLEFESFDPAATPGDAGKCNCACTVSLEKALAYILSEAPDRTFGTADLYAMAARRREFCRVCAPSSILSLRLYHLRQKGVAEKVGRGRFRFRKSDASSPDFVYGKRPRKP